MIEKIATGSRQEELNILLTEYKKAQDSAEHYASLSWLSISIIVGGLLVLLGGIVQSSGNLGGDGKSILILACFLALILTAILFPLLLISFRMKKNAKYERCRDIEVLIEKEFGVQMLNHLMFKPEKVKDKEVHVPKVGTKEGLMTKLFFVLLILPFSFVWSVLLWNLMGCCFTLSILLLISFIWIVIISFIFRP